MLMTKKSHDSDAFKLARAKSNATARTIKLVLFVQGGFALMTATFMTFVLAFMFHLNAPLAFAGSLLGIFLVTMTRTSIKHIWLSHLATCLQEEGLWDKANELATEGIAGVIEEILAGKQPQHVSLELPMKVSQLQVMAIRKGDLKKAVKYSEFLYKNSRKEGSGHSYQANSLGCGLLELGNYERGFELLTANLDEMEAQGRGDAPAYVSALLGMSQGCIDLERIDDAKKYLKRLQEAFELCHSKGAADKTDAWLKQESVNKRIEQAFLTYHQARLKDLQNDKEAELQMRSAIDMAKDPEVSRKVTLLYPEILLSYSQIALKKNDLGKAEKLAKEALQYYETKTQYKGGDYVRARRIVAQARSRKGENQVKELEELLDLTKSLVYEPHPSVAAAHFQLAEALEKQADAQKAADHIRLCLDARKRLFPEGSPGVREAENFLAGLPVQESV